MGRQKVMENRAHLCSIRGEHEVDTDMNFRSGLRCITNCDLLGLGLDMIVELEHREMYLLDGVSPLFAWKYMPSTIRTEVRD